MPQSSIPLLAACLTAVLFASAASLAEDATARPAAWQIGSRKQLFIDERFVAEKRDVALVVNPPVKAGPIDVEAITAPCVVEHGGVCHLYQGLNGQTSLWTSPDGLQWKAHGPIKGIMLNSPATMPTINQNGRSMSSMPIDDMIPTTIATASCPRK